MGDFFSFSFSFSFLFDFWVSGFLGSGVEVGELMSVVHIVWN